MPTSRLTTVGDRAFPVAAAWVWNTLSLKVSSQPALCQLSNVGWRRSSFYGAFGKLLQLQLTNLPIILWSDCVTFTDFCKVVLQRQLNATLIIFVNNNNNNNNNTPIRKAGLVSICSVLAQELLLQMLVSQLFQRWRLTIDEKNVWHR